jgi:hypothetical protein
MDTLLRKRFFSSVAVAGLTMLGMVSAAGAVAVLLPGTPLSASADAAADPFNFSFNENGVGLIAILQSNGSYGPPTVLKPIAGAPFLTWQLPEPVVPGDVSFAEPPVTACTSSANCSDGLRFTTTNTGSTMSFFSGNNDPGPAALADTGFPSGFNFTAFQRPETGSEQSNGFAYVAGPGTPSLTNFYNGVSDTVPEPSTWVMLVLGFGGLAFAGYWTSRKAVSGAA